MYFVTKSWMALCNCVASVVSDSVTVGAVRVVSFSMVKVTPAITLLITLSDFVTGTPFRVNTAFDPWFVLVIRLVFAPVGSSRICSVVAPELFAEIDR